MRAALLASLLVLVWTAAAQAQLETQDAFAVTMYTTIVGGQEVTTNDDGSAMWSCLGDCAGVPPGEGEVDGVWVALSEPGVLYTFDRLWALAHPAQRGAVLARSLRRWKKERGLP